MSTVVKNPSEKLELWLQHRFGGEAFKLIQNILQTIDTFDEHNSEKLLYILRDEANLSSLVSVTLVVYHLINKKKLNDAARIVSQYQSELTAEVSVMLDVAIADLFESLTDDEFYDAHVAENPSYAQRTVFVEVDPYYVEIVDSYEPNKNPNGKLT